MWKDNIPAHSFLPAASRGALKRISRAIRDWELHHRTDKSLQDLAEKYNPYIRGWINYYSHFYRSQLRPVLHQIDEFLFRWARRKFTNMRGQTKGARKWLERIKRNNPDIFAHWTLGEIGGRTS